MGVEHHHQNVSLPGSRPLRSQMFHYRTHLALPFSSSRCHPRPHLPRYPGLLKLNPNPSCAIRCRIAIREL